jgi:hypothetical protein
MLGAEVRPGLGSLHGRAIVRAQEAHSFLSDLRKLQKRHHLKADVGVSYRSFGHEVGRITHPPLSTQVSTRPVSSRSRSNASTCKNIVWP